MDEYYNKLWVADYYATNKPEYASQAKEQLVETVIKLLNIITQKDYDSIYVDERIILKSFLVNNLSFILFRSRALLGLKIMALKLIL